ncbi:putative ATP-dependent helicase IRC3 [Lithohypha guttulata]|uniref:putative ATP-dependent helicase IRC3 n=1 Tax=Lithohypha guttulata TaxID=1690604 RepID=UPI002DDE5A7F|nr:putative ATP-dependent helicase IRC3 [Lithohypha guttulata]
MKHAGFEEMAKILATVVADTPAVAYEEKLRLREYQEECIQSVLSYLKNGHKRLGVSLATGSGKTVIFTQLINRLEPTNTKATRTLILAHRRELVEQAAKHCRRQYPDKSIEIEMGDQHATGTADITVASVRSLQLGRLENYDPDSFKLVLVDEAHHIVASGYLEVLEHFGLEKTPAPTEQVPALVGVSATFSRFDGLRLGSAIDHIVYHKDYVDMIGEKWLCDVKFTTVKSGANLSRVRSNKDGDFAVAQLSAAVNSNEINEITVKSWMSEAGDRKSTLVFCVDLDHVAALTDTFRTYGVDAQFITGSTKKNIRGERLDAFKSGKFPVLLNCGVFTEGTDIPGIDCILLCRPTKSRNLLVQMIGRGMRLHPNKADCHVIDMVASLETGIVTVPTLFGLDPGEVVKNASSSDLEKLKEQRVNTQEKAANASSMFGSQDASAFPNRNLTFTHYDSVHDLLEDTSGERHVRAMSPNAWVQVDSDKYILSPRSGILTLERRRLTPAEIAKANKASKKSNIVVDGNETPLYHVIYKYPLPLSENSKAPYSKPRTIATASTLTSALNAADTFAATKFERLFIAKSSSWRSSPASEGQLDFINKLRYVTEDEPLTSEDLTKGQAGDMITKIKFGVRGRFDKLIVKKRKEEKELNKARSLRDKEQWLVFEKYFEEPWTVTEYPDLCFSFTREAYATDHGRLLDYFNLRELMLVSHHVRNKVKKVMSMQGSGTYALYPLTASPIPCASSACFDCAIKTYNTSKCPTQDKVLSLRKRFTNLK